jgi:DNA-binding NtrC family response regulator
LFTKIILLEDEQELQSVYVERLSLHGFTNVVAFSDTAGMLARVRELYVEPTIVLTDYFISPSPPTQFLPELRQNNIGIPVVIMSSRVRFELLSDLNASCGLAGFFAKGVDPEVCISRVANALMDMSKKAIDAWEAYVAIREALEIVRKYKPEKREVMRRLVEFADPKELYADGLASKDVVYDVRTDMIRFFRKGEFAAIRFNAMLKALEQVV